MGCKEYITKPTLIKPPQALTQNCNITEPLNEVEFKLKIHDFMDKGASSQWEAAFLVQTEQWFRQVNNLSLCNIQMLHLREWFNKQEVMLNENSGGDIN